MKKKSELQSNRRNITFRCRCDELLWLFFYSPEVTLVLLSVREQDNWLEKEASRIKIIQEWLTHQTKDCLCPVFVFCVEQISMALSLHAGIRRRSLLSLWERYYCPDSLLTAYPPLQALYRCEDVEEGNVRAIRIGT